MPNTLITEKQLGERLGKSVRTLGEWRRRREGPPWTKIGRTPMYHEAKVNQWLEEQTRLWDKEGYRTGACGGTGSA